MENEKINQATLYEFKPSDDISIQDIKELSEVVRVGITGRVLENLSPNLRKHFMEVQDGQMERIKKAS